MAMQTVPIDGLPGGVPLAPHNPARLLSPGLVPFAGTTYCLHRMTEIPPFPQHGIKDNHTRGKVADFLKARLVNGRRLCLVSAGLSSGPKTDENSHFSLYF